MAQTVPLAIERKWREERPVVDARAARARARRRRLTILLALMLLLGGVAAGMLAWLEPLPSPYFVPCWITSYRSNLIPSNTVAELDRRAIRSANFFTNTSGSAAVSQDRRELQQELAALSERSTTDAVVIYLSAYGATDGQGRVYLLTSDSEPDNSSTRLPLRQVLEQVAACPASQKLLVLDVAWPIADPRLGILANDVAEHLGAELEQVKDEGRLVLTSCSAGQVNLESGDLQQSVFGYYFYRGLAGDADGYNERNERDGRVSVFELAAFLTTRVDRWASQNRQARQIPILHGTGRDFELVALPQAQPAAVAALPPVEPYPEWLTEGWQLRDSWLATQRYNIAPRYGRQLESALLWAEERWAAGEDPERVEEDIQAQIDFFDRQMKQAMDELPVAQPRSLARAGLAGQTMDPAFGTALDTMLTSLAAQIKTLTPDKVEAARAKALAAFFEAQKEATGFDYARGVINQLISDQEPTVDRVQTLATILGHVQPHPQYVETLFLDQLAQLSTQLPAGAWPTATIRTAGRAICRGEEAAMRVRSLAWVSPMLDQAMQLRHNGMAILLNPGYAPAEDAGKMFQQSLASFETILAYEEMILDASQQLDQAFARLTPLGRYLDDEDQLSAIWMATTHAAGDLASSLVPPPIEQPLTAAELRRRLEGTYAASNAVKYGLSQLEQPFTDRGVSQLIVQCEAPAAPAAVWLDANAVLAMPTIGASNRGKLWNASKLLSRRLAELTLRADVEDNQQQQQTPALDQYSPEPAIQRERVVAVERGCSSIALLRMGGLNEPEVLKLNEVLSSLRQELTSQASGVSESTEHQQRPLDANFYADLIRGLWAIRLPQAILDTQQAALRNRLSMIYPPQAPLLLLDDPSTNPRVQWLVEQTAGHNVWLARHYQYEASDGASSPFYAEAAHEYLQIAGIQPEPLALLYGPTALPNLTLSTPVAGCTLTWTMNGMPTPRDVSLSVLLPTGVPLDISTADVVTPTTTSAALRVALTGQTPAAGDVPARGFMVQLEVDGKCFHHLVDVPYLTTARELEILLSTNPKQPEPALDALSFRPLAFWQPLYLYVRNTGEQSHELIVELTAGEVASAKLSLGPGQTLPVQFVGDAPQPNSELPEVLGPIRVKLLDASDQSVLAERAYQPRCMAPREYVRIVDAQFRPQSLVANRLSVSVEATKLLAGPPCAAELRLPVERIPGLLGVNGGAFRTVFTAVDQPATLYAQDMQFAEGTSENGYFYIDVDGCKRAFVFHATFAREGNPTTPSENLRPSVRLEAPMYAVAGGDFQVTIPVDNPPAGAQLHLALGRRQGGAFLPNVVQPFPTAKHERIGFAPHGKKSEMLVEVQLEDWSVSLDTSGIVGERELIATLVSSTGQEIESASQTVVLDRGPPSGVLLVNLPSQAVVADPLVVQMTCAVSISGIQSVKFFCGAPADGKIPPNMPTVAGSALDSGQTLWTATLTLPPTAKGPTPISVEVTNAIGLSTFATGLVDVVDSLPPKAGNIEGTVVEGPRPQAGLEVVLSDDKGKEKDKTQTKADGTFAFANVPAGNYTLTTAKPSSQRKGQLPVEVKPDATAVVTVPLYLGATGTAPN